jgi:hypothetical protein
MLASRSASSEDFAEDNDFLDSPAHAGRYVIKGLLDMQFSGTLFDHSPFGCA